MLSPAQKRKMSLAQDESERNAQFARADGSMRQGNEQAYYVAPPIARSVNRVMAATAKEDRTIAGMGD